MAAFFSLLSVTYHRHCERSEAIQEEKPLDCFARNDGE